MHHAHTSAAPVSATKASSGTGQSQRLRRFRQRAGQEGAAAARGGELAVLDDHAAAAQHRHRPAFEPAAFVGRVADIVMQHPVGNGGLPLGVPDRDIGVAADCDGALLRIEPVELCVVGRGERDKGVEIEAPLSDPLGKQQWQPQFDAGYAIGYFLEGGLVALGKLARSIEPVGRVIGRKHLEGAVAQTGPHRLLRRAVARRRAAAELGAFHAGLGNVVGGQKQVLRAGFAVDLQAFGLGVADDLDRFGRRDVNQQDRHVEQLR